MRENMEFDCLQEEPKLILTYPHKSKFNKIGFSVFVLLVFFVLWVLKNLISYHTDVSDKMIVGIVLMIAPIFIWFMGYYLFINGVKLELYENNMLKYYTYGSRGNSILHFKFKLEDIEQIKMKNRPFHCLKLIIKIRNPIFYGLHEKKLNKLMKVSIIIDRKKSDFFIQQMERCKKIKESI